MTRRPKIVIVGAGQTGGTMAHLLLQRRLGEVVLIDLMAGMAEGKARDLRQAAALEGYDPAIKGYGLDVLEARHAPEIIQNADVIVNTAGAPRKPGETRESLAARTVAVLRKTVPPLIAAAPEAIYIGFTNPMDAATMIAAEIGPIVNRRHVIGQGGLLDSARFRAAIAERELVSVHDVSAYVLGAHTEANMVPVVSQATIAGTPITKILGTDSIRYVVEQTRNGGAEIVRLMQTGSAFYAPAAATVAMIQSILLDEDRIYPCAVYAEKSYGLPEDSFTGLLVTLGRGGVKRIHHPRLSNDERTALHAAATATRELAAQMRTEMRADH